MTLDRQPRRPADQLWPRLRWRSCRSWSLCGAIVLLLLLRLFRGFDRWHLGWVALVLDASVALSASAGSQWRGYVSDPASRGIVRDMLRRPARLRQLHHLPAPVPARLHRPRHLAVAADRHPRPRGLADFYCLLLGATLGMSLMASANHLLMVFIGVEMASLPSYALAGFLKGRRQSSEAALKYVVYGGGAAGVMLYGISLLAGKFGTGYLPDLAAGLCIDPPAARGFDPVLILGTLFILIGIAFKLAAVPFHFWCPDVFEGAAAEVAGFLSVASKGAALALLARFALVLGG